MIGVYTRLMWMYPPSFRARFGDEMLQLVRDEATDGRRVPWLRTFADLFGSAFVRRWEETHMKTKLLIVPLGLAGALVVPLAVVGSAFSVATLLVLLAELGVATLIGGVAFLIGRRARGAEYDYAGRKFRWWWVPAGLIGATEVIMITKQFIDEPKATNLFAMVVICSFAALVFTGLAIRNRRAGNWMIVAGIVPVTTLFWLIYPAVVALVVMVCALADNVRMARARPAV